MRLKIVLFALTGMGNEVFRSLCRLGHMPALVVTRREAGTYPYYDETQLVDEVIALGGNVSFDAEGEIEAERSFPDIIISATYHRLIPSAVISSAGCAFNMHPSLLPKYSGRNPFFWVLRQGEKTTGVTVHRLTSKFDEGDIVLQQKTDICINETQGTLRLKLAKIAGDLTNQLIDAHTQKCIQSQHVFNAITAPSRQITDSDRALNLCSTFSDLSRHIRALSPWPLATIDEISSEVLEIIEVEYNAHRTMVQGEIVCIESSIVKVVVADAVVSLRVRNKQNQISRL